MSDRPVPGRYVDPATGLETLVTETAPGVFVIRKEMARGSWSVSTWGERSNRSEFVPEIKRALGR